MRSQLEAAFEGAETDTPVVETVVTAPAVGESQEAADQRARDEQGRFAAKALAKEPVAAPAVPPVIPPAQVPGELQRPTTWKKEYMPMWEKLASGQQLSPEEARKFLEYANQRESEFKTGVSTYKQEAERARELQQAIEPFMPQLQQYGIQPTQWIQNLGRAHQTLALGSPEQKLQMFSQLAREYGVPMAAIQSTAQGQAVEPAYAELMGQIQQLQGQVQTVTSWRQEQEQRSTAQAIAELQNDAAQYPHFAAVRGDMARLLESGLSPDLKTAYKQAVRMNDEVWQQEQARLAQAAQAQSAASQQQTVAKAKANAFSTRSATPSGTATAGGPKDRRSVLSEAFDEAGARV